MSERCQGGWCTEHEDQGDEQEKRKSDLTKGEGVLWAGVRTSVLPEEWGAITGL